MKTILTSIIPKSKFLGVCFGIIISCLTAILCALPCYFLKEKVVFIYFIAVYFCVPVAIGFITTLMLGYHKQSSILASILYSQLALILSFITLGMIFQMHVYVGAFLIMYSPLLILFTAIGTMIGCEYLLRKGKLKLN